VIRPEGAGRSARPNALLGMMVGNAIAAPVKLRKWRRLIFVAGNGCCIDSQIHDVAISIGIHAFKSQTSFAPGPPIPASRIGLRCKGQITVRHKNNHTEFLKDHHRVQVFLPGKLARQHFHGIQLLPPKRFTSIAAPRLWRVSKVMHEQ
jgi:hypothetical protein